MCRYYMLVNRNKKEKESDDAKGAMSILCVQKYIYRCTVYIRLYCRYLSIRLFYLR